MEFIEIYRIFRPPSMTDFLWEGLSRPEILDWGIKKGPGQGGRGWDLGPKPGWGVTQRLSQRGEHVWV